MNGACGGVWEGGGEMRSGARGGEARENACGAAATFCERVGEDIWPKMTVKGCTLKVYTVHVLSGFSAL